MQLGIRHPLRYGPAYQSVTLSVNVVDDGFVVVDGCPIGTTRTDPVKLLRWPDPRDVSTYTVVTLPASTPGTGPQYNSTAGLCYDATTGLCYAVFNNYIDADADESNRFISFPPSDPSAWTDFSTIKSQSVIGFGQNNLYLTSDGTYLYALTAIAAENAWVYRMLLSDGSLVDALQLTGSNRRRGSAILYDGSRLYVVGRRNSSPQTNWFGWVELDLSAQSTITYATGTFFPNDDPVIVGSDIWIGDETVSTLWQLPKSLATPSSYPLGVGQWVDGLVYDGSQLWVGIVDDPDPAKIVTFDPVAGKVTEVRALRSGDLHPNELAIYPGFIDVFTFTSPAKAICLPL